MRPKRLRLEHKSEPLLPPSAFRKRMLLVTAAGAAVVAFALFLGALGYRLTEGWGWLDATLNASMILTGMGPVDALHTAAGKVFASGYALFSGVVFLSLAALFLTPVAHRILHAFHLQAED